MSRDNPNKSESGRQIAQARKAGRGAALIAFERETIRIAPDDEVAQLRRTEPPLPVSYLWTGRDGYGRIVVTRAEATALERLNATRKGFCSRTAGGLTLSGHCGIVRVKTAGRPDAPARSITLEILPTLWGGVTAGADAAERAAELGAARRVSMRMLARATGLPISEPDMTRQVLENTSLLDLLVRSFLREALRVTKHGLLAGHAGAADDLPALRGRFAVAESARTGVRRPGPYDDLTVDNPHNRALLAALEISRKNIRHTSTERLWVDTRAMFASVSSVRMTARQVAQLDQGRETVGYRAALRWAGLLLDLLSPSPAAGKAGAQSLLFCMEPQFEAAAHPAQLPDRPTGWANSADRSRIGRPRHLGAAPSDHEQRC